MTCKDCIHYEMCKRIDNKMETKNMSLNETIQEMCRDFKDKSKYIELPFKVGDTLYDIYGLDYKVESINISGTTVIWFRHQDNPPRVFDITEIGKTVFLTKSEAEQKLKELQNK